MAFFSTKSVAFDGSDEYTDVGDTYDFDRTDAFSISYWVRADPAAGAEFVIAKGAAPTPEGWWSLIRFDGKVVFAMINTWTTNDLRVRADNVNIRDSFWHHVVTTHDGSGTAAGVNHIIDGVLASAVAESDNLTGSVSNTATLRFATRENGYPSESLAGSLDEIAIYNRVLSLAEAQAIFNAGVPLDLSSLPSGPDLLGWWRMGDGDTFPVLTNQIAVDVVATYPTIPDESGLPSVPLMADASGNGLDGTMVNMESTDVVYGTSVGYGPLDEPIDVIRTDDDGWLFNSNYSGTGTPGVMRFEMPSRRTLSYTIGGVAIETFVKSAFDATDIWVGGDDGSGNAQLKKLTIADLPVFSSAYSVSSNSFVSMVYGAGYLWVADLAGIWRVDPAVPGGPHTSVVTQAGIVDLHFDADTANYGDSQPRLWAITDDGNGLSLRRYDINTLAQDGVVVEAGASNSAVPKAITVGGGDAYIAWTDPWVAQNKTSKYTLDPPAFVLTSTNINSYMAGELLDIAWDDNIQVLVYGAYTLADPYPTVIRLNTTTLNSIQSNILGTGPCWTIGAPHPQIGVFDGYVWCPAMTTPAGVAEGLWRAGLTWLPSKGVIGPHKLYPYSARALSFDGVNEYVDMGDVLGFDRTDPFSISLWVKMTATGNTEPLVSKLQTVGWFLRLMTDGKLEIIFQDASSNMIIRRSSTSVGDGNWHHCVMAYDGSNNANGITFYVDNSPEGVTAMNLPCGSLLNAAELLVGRAGPSVNSYLAGSLDEVAVYNKELSTVEVSAIYNYGAPLDLNILGSAANLAAWWRMGEGIGTYDGTMVNMAPEDLVQDIPRSSFCKYSLEFPYNAFEYYDMGDVHAFEYTDSFSVSCWFKTTAPSGRSMYLVFKEEGSAPYRGYALRVAGVLGVQFSLNYDTDVSDRIVVRTTATVHDGEWHHALVTWAGSVTPVAADVTIYIDGVAQAVTVLNDSLTGTILNTEPFCIGNRADNPSQYLDGRIAEGSVWDKTLSAAEAAWVYNFGLPRDIGAEESTNSLSFDEAENHSLSGGDIIHGIDRGTDFSFSIWFKTSNTTSTQCLFGKTVEWSGYPHGWQIGIYPSGVIWIWMLYTWSPSNQLRTCTSSSWADGQWHHLAWTHDTSISGGGKKADCKVYIDGVLQALDGTAVSQIDTLANNVDTPTDFRIGDVVNNFYTFDGGLDEAAIYKDKVLGVDEVRWLAGNPSDLKAINAPSGLHAWWRLGESLDGARLVREETDGAATLYSPLTTSIDLNNGVTNQVIDFASVSEADFNPGEPFTFGIWVKSPMPPYDPHPVAPRTDTLMMKHRTGGADRGFCLQTDYRSFVVAAPQLIVKAAIEQATVGSWYSFQVSYWSNVYARGKPWWDDVWHLVIVRWDGAAAQVWTDGQRRGEQMVSGPSGDPFGGEPVADGHLLIGNHDVGGSEYGEGNVCHAFIYDKALSSTEIRAVHGEGVPQDLSTVGPTANLVFWSALGDGDTVGADNVLDLSGNDNHGTFTNGDSGDFVAEVPLRTRDLTRAGKDSWWNGTPGAPTGDIPAVSTDVPLALLADLKGWWRCGTKDNPAYQLRDAGADPTVVDTTGVKDQSRYNAHTALVNTPSIVSDTPGGVATYSLDLNSEVDDYFSYRFLYSGGGYAHADMGDALGFERTDSFTVSFWIRSISNGNPDFILGKMEGSTAYTGWRVYMDTDEKIVFDLISDNATDKLSVQADTVIPYGTGYQYRRWQHIVITYDGSSDASGVIIYRDGSPDSMTILNNTLTASILTTAAFQLMNVSYNTSSTYRWRGDMDEVAIWNRALSAAEVTWVHNGGLPNDLGGSVAPPDLAAWWRMGDGDTFPMVSDNFPVIRTQHPPNTDPNLTTSIALNLDGVSERVGFGDVAEMDFSPSSPFTVGIWIRTLDEGSGRGNNTGLQGGINSVNAYSKAGLRYHAFPVGGWRFYIFTGGIIGIDFFADHDPDDSIMVETASGGWNDGQWHLLTATYGGSGSVSDLRLFIDGDEPAFNTLGTGTVVGDTTTVQPLSVGTTGTYTLEMAGQACHSFGYDVELTSAEVALLYTDGRPQDLSGLAHSADLVHWCRLGDGCAIGADNCPDLSGLGNHGTTFNVETTDFVLDVPPIVYWTPYSPLTTCIDLNNDTVDESIDFGHFAEASFTLSTPFSIGAWIKWSGSTSGIVFGKYTDSPSTGFYFYVTATHVIFRMDNASNSGYATISWGNITNDGEWHHIVCTYDGSNPGAFSVQYHMDIYVDGVKGTYSTGGTSMYSISSASALLKVGLRMNQYFINEFIGKVCHSSVYNKELTLYEVAALYGDGIPQDLTVVGPIANLVHWAALGDGDAIGVGNVIDLSTLGNDGTTINVESGDFISDAPFAPVSHDGTISSTSLMEYQPYYPPGCHLFNEQIIDGVARASHHFEGSRSFTISYWIKTTSEIGTVFLSGSEREFAGFATYLEGGYPQFCVNDLIEWSRSVTYGYTIRSKKRVDDGAWHHVVISQYQKGGANIWVDGVDEGKWTLVSALVNSIGTTGDLLIGGHRENYAPINGVKGKLTEVSIWSGYLGQDGADALYNSGSPPDLESLSFAKRLHGYWRMGASPGNPGVPVNILTSDYRKKGIAPGEEAWSTRALDFDNYNDVLSAGNVLAYEHMNAFSISMWFRADADESILPIKKFGTYGWQLGNYYTVHFQMKANPTGWIYMQTEDRKLFMAMEWYHIVATYDGSGLTSGVHIYVDGYSERLDNYTYTAFSGSIIAGDALRIANDNVYRSGARDEISMWGKELSQAEVTELYNGGVPGDLETHSAFDSIDAWWRMGEGRADATMINMEAEDIKNQAPGLVQQAEAALAGDASVTALGGYLLQAEAALEGDSAMTGELLGDLEIAADLKGDSSFVGAATVAYAAEAGVTGDSEMLGHPIVKVPEQELSYSGPLRTTDQVQRLVGFQPDRKPVVIPPDFTVKPRRRR